MAKGNRSQRGTGSAWHSYQAFSSFGVIGAARRGKTTGMG